jgi:hypothetical protein
MFGRHPDRLASLIAIAAFLAALSAWAGTESDVRILASDDQRIVLEYAPGPARIEKRTVPISAGRTDVFDAVSLAGCVLEDAPGKPRLPYRLIRLGIPSEGSVSVSILGSRHTSRGGLRVLPAPTRRQADSLGYTYAYEPDPAVYSRAGQYPGQLVQTLGTSFLRRQRILTLRVNPLQHDPVRRSLDLYERITIEVAFTGKPALRPVRADRHFEEVYRTTLANYEGSRAWRTAPARPQVLLRSPFNATETWYKISIQENGIYRLRASDLQAVGIDLATVDPRTVRIYSGGGKDLPLDITQPRPELKEVAITLIGEEDGRFDTQDYILFYGQGLYGWHYDPELESTLRYDLYANPYTRTNVYWLTYGGTAGKRMTLRDGSLTDPNPVRPTAFAQHVRVEEDHVNPYNYSGRQWCWEFLQGTGAETVYYTVTLPGVDPASPCTLRTWFLGHTSGTHHVRIYLNDHLATDTTWSGAYTLRSFQAAGPWLLRGQNTLRVEVPRDIDPNDRIYFDWFEVSYSEAFEATGDALLFSTAGTEQTGRFEFSVSPLPARTCEIMDVSDPIGPVRISPAPAISGGVLRFQDRVDSTQTYFLAAESAWRTPTSLSLDSPSDLRNSSNSADYLIITPDDFYNQLLPLKAERENRDGFRVKMVRLGDVFDEFSWGLEDPTAIRDFLKYAYDTWATPPSYVLLVGDGTADWRGILSASNARNYVPTYQTLYSDWAIEAGVREYGLIEDWFAFLDNAQPEGDCFAEMYLGRLSVQTAEDAAVVVGKILNYEDPSTYGDFRNRVLFVADDEWKWGARDALPHTQDTERLERGCIPASYDRMKVYLMEYPFDLSNRYKPEAEADVIDRMSEGALLVNYIGHGNETKWAHEYVFQAPADIYALSNGSRLPFIVSGSCEVGRFDRPDLDCMAEVEVRIENKGAIGTFAAVRPTYPDPNVLLDSLLLVNLFSPDTSLRARDLGSAILEAKVRSGIGCSPNSEKYVLFGDPALRIGAPRLSAQLSLSSDSLKGRGTYTLRGQVLNGTEVFRGEAFVRIFDSAFMRAHPLYGTGPDTVRYLLPGTPFFKGPVLIEGDTFSLSFVVPAVDVPGEGGFSAGSLGRVSCYLWNETTDGSGYLDSLFVGGADTSAGSDTTRPTVALFANSSPLKDSSLVPPSFTLSGELFDLHGIDLSQQPGYLLTLYVDDPRRFQTPVDLARHFTYDLGSYQRGRFSYPLSLAASEDPSRDTLHTIEVSVADNFHNRTTLLLTVRVPAQTSLTLTDVVNYPNPFKAYTDFTFRLNQDADVTVQVFTVAGRPVQALKARGTFGYNRIPWDGRDADGDAMANGVYIYKITARPLAGSPASGKVEVVQKIVIMR